MKLNKILAAIAVAAMIVTIIAVCGSSESAPTESNDDLVGEGLGMDLGYGPVGYDLDTLVKRMSKKIPDITIAIQIQQTDEPWNNLWLGTLKNLARKYGIKLMINDAQNDYVLEVQQMEAACNAGVDGIIIFPIDPTGAAPIIKKTLARGVPVVTTFPAPGLEGVVTQGFSDYELAKVLAERVLKDFKGKKITAVIANIKGRWGILDERVQGYEDVLSKASNVTLLKDSYILEDFAEAWTRGTIDLLSRNENVNVIMAAYGAPAIYCAAGVKQSGRKVNIYGFDVDLAIARLIKEGRITAMHPYDARVNAYCCLFSILRLINGDKNVQPFRPAEAYLKLIIDKNNVEEYALLAFGEKL